MQDLRLVTVLGFVLLLLAPTAAIVTLAHGGLHCAASGAQTGGQTFEHGVCFTGSAAVLWAGALPAFLGILFVIVGLRTRGRTTDGATEPAEA